jgi:hypothetical protein
MAGGTRRSIGVALLLPVAIIEGVVQWAPSGVPAGTYLAVALLLLGAALGLRVMLLVVVGFLSASLSASDAGEGLEILVLLMPFFSICALAGGLAAALIKRFASHSAKAP